jgi:hypothetical protein
MNVIRGFHDPADAPDLRPRVQRYPTPLGHGLDEVATVRTDHSRPLPLERDLSRGIDADELDGRIKGHAHRLREVSIDRSNLARLTLCKLGRFHVALPARPVLEVGEEAIHILGRRPHGTAHADVDHDEMIRVGL